MRTRKNTPTHRRRQWRPNSRPAHVRAAALFTLERTKYLSPALRAPSFLQQSARLCASVCVGVCARPSNGPKVRAHAPHKPHRRAALGTSHVPPTPPTPTPSRPYTVIHFTILANKWCISFCAHCRVCVRACVRHGCEFKAKLRGDDDVVSICGRAGGRVGDAFVLLMMMLLYQSAARAMVNLAIFSFDLLMLFDDNYA